MTLPGTGLTPAELNSSDGQSANVGAARPCRLHWRYVTTQLSSLVRDCSKPLQTRSQVRTSTVTLQATGQGWCSPVCRPTHPGPLCSEIMVLTSRQESWCLPPGVDLDKVSLFISAQLPPFTPSHLHSLFLSSTPPPPPPHTHTTS